MERQRREFLRTMSTAAALPVLAPILKAAAETGSAEDPAAFPAAASLDFRAHFPLLKESVNGQPLVYLDSAATTQRPREVVDALSKFYLHDNANPAKSLHTLAGRSAAAYDAARAEVARFLNTYGPEEIVWTRGTTEAINLVAASWGGAYLGPGDEVLVTVSDHYSNLVPWQLATRRANATLRVLDVSDDGRLRLDQLDTLLSKRTKLVTFPHVSNVLGRINPAREICERAHRAGALVLVDAAQSVPHFPVDVQDLNCDFLAFSGHKMCGPMGVGVLWARPELLEAMPPFMGGGSMISRVDLQQSTWAPVPHKFEAGTPDVAGVAGLVAACD